MRFLRPSADITPLHDAVFAMAEEAARDTAENGDIVVNATIGTLRNEDGKLVAFDSVYNHYDRIDHRTKAAYAAHFLGNDSFRETVYHWVTGDQIPALPCSVIASPGGTGSLYSTMQVFIQPGDTVILPDVCWGNYRTMANMNGLKVRSFRMFDGDHFDLSSLRDTIMDVQKTAEKIFLIINDPCHNPTGYSMTDSEWQELISVLNTAAEKTPVILVDDIAYIDFANRTDSRAYMRHFEEISDNVMIVVSFSCSKSLSYYGMRCGASLVFAKDAEEVREAEIVLNKFCRAAWSNVNNAAMENFTWVINNNLEEYTKEKEYYRELLQKRASLFLREAEDAGLSLFPYKEGFFITLKGGSREEAAKLHKALINEHIYTVLLGENLRIGICSLPLRHTAGLAYRIRKVIDDR